MESLNYQFDFGDISDKLMPFSMMSYKIGTIDSYVSLGDVGLFVKLNGPMPSEVADLIDLAAAVFVADWLSFRSQDRRHNIRIKLPLRNPERYRSANILELLTDVLDWYTEDNWSFEFVSRKKIVRASEQQLCFFPPASMTEVALWSGGLDSLAGAYNRLSSSPEKHLVLFGTGSSSIAYHTQNDVFLSLLTHFPGRIELVRLPIKSKDTASIHKNHQFRVRGFTFLALGAACAYLEGQDALHIYENGVGAINLPYRASEIGLDHSRAVHPLSLFQMNKFVSAWFNSPFQFRNPFLFTTKADMCSVLKNVDVIFRTVTCDGPRREEYTQCGMCTSL